MVSASRDGVGDPRLTVAAVARRLGVAASTLRTWDRRYGLGPGDHASGRHRLYNLHDVARLEVMRRLTRQGATASEAARLALSADVDPAGGHDDPPDPDTSTIRAGVGTSRAAGKSAVRGLTRAAMSLDTQGMTDIVREHLHRRGVVETWESLLVPVLVGVGRRYETTGEGVDVEHALSECLMGAFREVTVRLEEPVNPRTVLLSCAEDDQHSLPLHALAAGLAERHVAGRVLGARVPNTALRTAVRRSGPAAVFLWSAMSETGNPSQLRGLPVPRPAPLFAVGGPGWESRRLPPGVRRVHRLAEAVTTLARAAGA